MKRWMQSATEIVNTSWLDELNMDRPTTLTRPAASLAFRDNDCNGNGRPHRQLPLGVL
jgi:hypothetical protein